MQTHLLETTFLKGMDYMMMMHVVEQTREEKIAMYMKLTKREIIEMLLNNQELLRPQRHDSFHVNVGPPVADLRYTTACPPGWPVCNTYL